MSQSFITLKSKRNVAKECDLMTQDAEARIIRGYCGWKRSFNRPVIIDHGDFPPHATCIVYWSSMEKKHFAFKPWRARRPWSELQAKHCFNTCVFTPTSQTTLQLNSSIHNHSSRQCLFLHFSSNLYLTSPAQIRARLFQRRSWPGTALCKSKCKDKATLGDNPVKGLTGSVTNGFSQLGLLPVMTSCQSKHLQLVQSCGNEWEKYLLYYKSNRRRQWE